jgi:hypothetical protein
VTDPPNACPGLGVDYIRHLLAHMQKEEMIKALGTDWGAQWEKLGDRLN